MKKQNKKRKESNKMGIAFFLNLFFSVLELLGSFLTGSVAIASDAIHDFADVITIGISWFLEGKSNRSPNETYTYGYRRYSVLAGVFGTLVLLVGSVAVIVHAVGRMIAPKPVSYDDMLWFALAGILFNGIAAYITHGGESVNQKAVNLHMAEDVLGWIAVLLGAVLIKFTHIWVIDPLLSVVVTVFVIINAVRNLKNGLDILLEKAPTGFASRQVKELAMQAEGVIDAHHIHLWSLDGITHCVTMHLITQSNSHKIKEQVKEILQKQGIFHVTLELETAKECCIKTHCDIVPQKSCHHHHHH